MAEKNRRFSRIGCLYLECHFLKRIVVMIKQENVYEEVFHMTYGEKDTILYYPSIKIEDGPWLRNAVLYWDKIASIVPGIDYQEEIQWKLNTY